MSVSGLRVTGGRLGGRRLRTPARGVRPTPERVRESLFTRLGELEGTTVLDLYAGSGALGIEAASRGAVRVVFVERAPAVRNVLRRNLRELGLEEACRVVAGDAVAAVRRLARDGEVFDLVLMDPPYGGHEAVRGLEAVARAGVLAERAIVVVEHDRHAEAPVAGGLRPLDSRRYGDTVITWLVPETSGGGRQGDTQAG